MKILVLGSRIPFPAHDGGAIATLGMLKELAGQGQSVTYFTFNTKKHLVSEADIQAHFSFCRVLPQYLDASPKPLDALMALLRGVNYNVARFYTPQAAKELETLLKNETFDVIHFESLFTFPFFEIVKKYSQAPCVLRQHNVEYKIWEKLAQNSLQPIKKWYLGKLAKSLKKYEVNAIQSIQNIVSITAEDEQVFKSINSAASFFLYPAGINISIPEKLPEKKPFTLCHIGSMEWMPNVEAVKWFMNEIWPSVLQKWPQAEFHIAGKSLDPQNPDFNKPGVMNHGEVDDANAFMLAHTAAIVPLLAGSGLRMKTLGAMALGMPVISTTMGASGIPVEKGENILLADSLDQWMAAISGLFEQPNLALSIGQAAKKMVAEKYSATILTRELIGFYAKISNP